MDVKSVEMNGTKDSTPDRKKISYDDVLKKIGEFGYYQKRIFAILCYQPLTSGLLQLISTFTLATPDHRCALPDYDNDTYFPQNDHHRNLINQSIPASSSCLLRNQNRDEYGNVTSSEYKCHSWVYDTSTFTSTFVTDFNLVCDDAVLKSNAVMMLFFGLLVGYSFLGNVADFFGRKPVMVASNYLVVIMCFLLVWTPSYTFLMVIRFFLGLGVSGQALTVYIIGLEIVGPSKRRFTGIMSNLTWVVGMFILALLGYMIRTWRYVVLGVAVLSSVLLTFVILIPESPRWLLTRGYHKKAKVIIEKVTKANQTQLSEDDLPDITDHEKPKCITFWKIFTSRKLLIRTGAIYINWFAASIIYYGIVLNLENLVGNIYLNLFLVGVLETVCYTSVVLLVDRLGRKKLMCLSLLLSGVCLTAVIFVIVYASDEMKWMMTALTLIGQFGAASAFVINWLWTGELFPTELRNFGTGTSSAMARLASLAAPYFGYISSTMEGDFKDAAPYLIYVGFCFIALVLTYFLLPETVNRPLTDTIGDWEDLGKRNAAYVEEKGEMKSI